MKKLLLLLLPCMAVTSLPAFATGIGSMQNVRDNDSKFSLDAGYYYQRSDYEGIDAALAEDAVEDIVRDAPYIRANYQFLSNWFVSGIYGSEKIANDPDESALKLDSDLRDTFYGVQLKGKLYDSNQLDVGAFIQYSRHADYSFAGTALTTSYDVEVKGLEDILAGVMLQKEFKSFDLYGGAFYLDSRADVKGDVNTLPFKETLETQASVGGMLGVNFHVHDEWDINLEYQNRGDHGVDIGLTYHFKKPTVTTVTKVVTKVVEVPVLVAMPVIKPDSFDATVNFSENSNEVDKSQRGIFRQLSRFLDDNPKATAYIEGHCDCVGPEAANQSLSEERALSVKNYIVEYYAIDESRIMTEGYGEHMPIDTNDTAEGRKNNRRVQIYAFKK